MKQAFALTTLAMAAMAVAGCNQIRASEAKKIAAQQLSDPESARFRGIVVRSKNVCGQISGHTPMGLDAGFRGFVVVANNMVWVEPALGEGTGLGEQAGPNPPLGEFASLSGNPVFHRNILAAFYKASVEACGVNVGSAAVLEAVGATP